MLLCPVKSSQIYSLSKKYKSCLLWPLLRSHFYETSLHMIKISFSPINLFCVNFIVSPAKNSRGVEGEISLSPILCYLLNPILHPTFTNLAPFSHRSSIPDSLNSAARPWISHQSQWSFSSSNTPSP